MWTDFQNSLLKSMFAQSSALRVFSRLLMTNHLHTQLAGYRLTAERGNHVIVLKLDYFVTGSATSDLL